MQPPARTSSDTRRAILIVAAIAAIVAVPTAIVGGIDWLDLSGSWVGSSRPQPKWLTCGEVKATTSDGTLVKLRVAFDVRDSGTKAMVPTRMRDVSLLLELSIGALTTVELVATDGIERLSREMLRRVNEYLRVVGVAPLRAVAIQDLWYTRPSATGMPARPTRAPRSWDTCRGQRAMVCRSGEQPASRGDSMQRMSFLAGALLAVAVPVSAQTVWTDWTSATAGAPGSAAGTLNGTDVSYAGEVLGNRVINGAFSAGWAPSTSFVGGTVATSPATVGDIITLNGTFTGTNTLTFASPITNPLVAIWSLGQPGRPASFTFDATPTLQVGGPNINFGGSSITVSGNVVSGAEGNGVVQFDGTFTSLSWTDTFEHYYGFTVGTAGSVVTPVPEPATWGLLAAGLLALGLRRKT